MDGSRVELGEKPPDFGRHVQQAMRECRWATGKTLTEWAAELQAQVQYGTVRTATVECYEAGRNVPGADYYLAAMATAGLPVHRIVELWLDPTTRGTIRWLFELLATTA